MSLPGQMLLVLLLLTTRALSAEPPPFADIHLHYKWNQVEVTSPAQAVAQLRKENVVLAVVSSIPPAMALELRQAGGDWIIPFYMPYRDESYRHLWYRDPAVPGEVRTALASGQYRGIGEIHLLAGLGPHPNSPVLVELMKLAVEFDVPVSIHLETSSHKYFKAICTAHPRVRFLWAHAGGLLDDKEVAALMAACPNVWVEFSARDPGKYVNSPIVDEHGMLLPGWAALVRRYPDRFMTGSDPIWPVEDRNRWNTPDSGWQKHSELLAFHRRWLSGLPPDLEEKIRLGNAVKFLRATPRTP